MAFGPNGEIIMDYSIHDAINAGFNKVVFIIRTDLKEAFENHYAERFKDKIKMEFAYQNAYTEHTADYEDMRKNHGEPLMQCFQLKNLSMNLS